LLLLCAGSALAQKPDAAADKTMLIALENAWNQAQIHRDGKALADLVTDDFIFTDWDGSVMNKSKYIADAQDTSVQTTLVANDKVEVFFYPGVAVVAGAYHAKGTNRGKPFDHYGRFTDTWILSKGNWKCVASHTNLIKK
jgi:ketosteroid isomerase-like protein